MSPSPAGTDPLPARAGDPRALALHLEVCRLRAEVEVLETRVRDRRSALAVDDTLAGRGRGGSGRTDELVAEMVAALRSAGRSEAAAITDEARARADATVLQARQRGQALLVEARDELASALLERAAVLEGAIAEDQVGRFGQEAGTADGDPVVELRRPEVVVDLTRGRADDSPRPVEAPEGCVVVPAAGRLAALVAEVEAVGVDVVEAAAPVPTSGGPAPTAADRTTALDAALERAVAGALAEMETWPEPAAPPGPVGHRLAAPAPVGPVAPRWAPPAPTSDAAPAEVAEDPSSDAAFAAWMALSPPTRPESPGARDRGARRRPRRAGVVRAVEIVLALLGVAVAVVIALAVVG